MCLLTALAPMLEALGEARECGTIFGCFGTGTPVLMADGTYQPIQDIMPGEWVQSANERTGEVEARQVQATTSHPASQVMALTLTDARTGARETLTCTPNHPFYVDGKGFVEAGDLGIGTSIVTRAGPASAGTPVVVKGGEAVALSVLGASPGGESGLTYTWTETLNGTAVRAAIVPNGTNEAKITAAMISQVGTYCFTVVIADRYGASVTSSVTVTVVQAPANIVVTPAALSLPIGSTQLFTATLLDQFGNVIPGQSFDWSVDNTSCSIDPVTGVFTAGFFAGAANVTATDGDVTGTASVTVADILPAVAVASSADPNPVMGTVTSLSVLGADVSGESTLRYTWSCTGPAAVAYSANGTNTAKNTTVTFSQAGTYVFTVTISDGVNPSVTVTVDQTASSVSVQPYFVQLSDGGTQQFSASDVDQFGNVMPTQPSSFTWAITHGTGTINQVGLYRAPLAAEIDLVQAADGNINGVAEVLVTNPMPLGGSKPLSPTDLSAVAGNEKVLLTWDETDTSTTGYHIYRATMSGYEGATPIATVNAGSGMGITYTDTGLINGTTYYYVVTAFNDAGDSVISNEAFATPFNVPPSIVVAASAIPPVVIGNTVTLQVTATDDLPPSNLTYVWSVSGPASVTFSTNGTNGSDITVATFTQAGTYIFTVVVTDSDGATVASSVTVVVQQTLTAISVQTPSPSSPISGGGSYFFQTGGTDQFGNPMSSAGATYAVTSGSGTVSASSDPSGVEFHAPGGTSAETDTITMTDGTFTKTITVSVAPSPANSGYWAPSPFGQPNFTASVSVTKDDSINGPSSQTLTVPSDETGIGLGPSQSGKVSLSGSISWSFAWTPDPQNDPPPSVTYFAVSGGVGGSYYDFANPGGSGSPSAADGFGDPEQDSSGPYQDPGSSTQGILFNAFSSGTYLFKEGSNASVTVATKQFTASASGGVGANDSGLLQAGYGFTAGPVSPPSVGVISPSDDAIITAGGDVTVSVHADATFLSSNDASNLLQSLSLTVTGGSGSGGDLTPDPSGNASLDLGTLPAGTYTATVAATYVNGTGTVEVDSAPVTFYVVSFTVKTGSWNPDPAYVGDPITGQVQGTFDPNSIDGMGSGPFFVTYAWTTGGVWYSQDGTSGTFEPYIGDYSVAWTQGHGDTAFTAVFNGVGFFILGVECVATVYSQYTGSVVAVLTQTGYIGGSASDIDQSGGGTGHMQKAHQLTAHDGGGGTGIPVDPDLFMLYKGKPIASDYPTPPLPQPQQVMIGQKINLQSGIAGDLSTGTEPTFQWSVDGFPIQSYTQSGGPTYPIYLPVSPTQTQITFYWTTPGTYNVTVRAYDSKHVAHTAAATFIVEGVIVNSFTGIETGHTPPVFAGKNYAGGQGLSFGNNSSPGISCWASIVTPGIGAGQISFVQTIDSTRTIQITGLPLPVVYTNPTFSFDFDGIIVQVPQTALDNSDGPIQQKIKSVPGGSPYSNESDPYVDSPSQSFKSNYSEVSVNESFVTYLMYQPNGSDIWVGLATLFWSWSGAAMNKSGKWFMQGTGSPTVRNAVISGSCNSPSAPTLLPTWQTNVGTF